MKPNAPTMKPAEAESFRKQQTAFCILTLFVIAVLLLLHTIFASLLGEPTIWVIVLLGVSFSLKVFELTWVQGRIQGISEKTARIETAISVAGIFVLAGLLAFFTNRDDAPYFVLLAIPILQCAYHFGLLPTLLTIGSAIGMIFFWIEHYFAVHPPAQPTEFLEAGMISVIFAIMGILVWFLVHQLKKQQIRLAASLLALESARESLIREEKLAAIGRLAGNLAHEIRNPVAMISSSLTTAANPEVNEKDRAEMLLIAAREGGRLEKLTTEFLNYARPRAPQHSAIYVSDLLSYTTDVVKAHASERSIDVKWSAPDDLFIEADTAQVQSALLNLILNGIDAASSPGVIVLEASHSGTWVQINVRNTGPSISEANLPRLFEPFFTTKPSGTGLGLAIARGVALAHGGDLWVSCNKSGKVIFSMTLSICSQKVPDKDS